MLARILAVNPLIFSYVQRGAYTAEAKLYNGALQRWELYRVAVVERQANAL